MSNGVFLLVMIALGFVILIYFNQRARNYHKRHPDRDNPIERWMTGEDGKEDKDDKDGFP